MSGGKRPTKCSYLSLSDARVTERRLPLQQDQTSFWRQGNFEGEISLECSLVLLDMNDEFRLSNTLFDINF